MAIWRELHQNALIDAQFCLNSSKLLNSSMSNHNFYPKPSKHWIEKCGTIRSLFLTGHHIIMAIFRACIQERTPQGHMVQWDRTLFKPDYYRFNSARNCNCIQRRLLYVLHLFSKSEVTLSFAIANQVKRFPNPSTNQNLWDLKAR